MRKWTVNIFTIVIVAMVCLPFHLNAHDNRNTDQALTAKQQSIVSIAAYTAQGDLQALKPALNDGLDARLSINQIKEVLVHLYAYCGFPRSIRGLQTFMEVLDERKGKGINDIVGAEASPIQAQGSKYERGKKVLEKLTGATQQGPATGYSAFSPEIDTFLKEHLFADIFERDVLTYAERELVTISVISTIGGAEPMLRSHLNICLKVGLTAGQLQQFVTIMNPIIGEQKAKDAQAVLNEVLKIQPSQGTAIPRTQEEAIFPKGEQVAKDNFTGTAYHYPMITPDSVYQTQVGSVTFEPKARTNWHKHPAGQILLVTQGKGYYQEKGKAARLIRKGDVVRIPPHTEHWHGAAPDSSLIHIAVNPNINIGKVVWLNPVKDEEYSQSIK